MEPDAAAAEIRDAFRALVRLLHPDHQQDEHLKAIAEKQLRKLNRIYEVLSDPERRRRYDESREGALREPTIVFSADSKERARLLMTRLSWVGATVLGVAALIWFAVAPPMTPVMSAPEREAPSSDGAGASVRVPAASAPVAGDSDEVAQLRAALRVARSDRDEARRELAEMKERAAGLAESSVPPPPQMATPLTSAATSMAESTPARPSALPARPASAAPVETTAPRTAHPPAVVESPFAGFWFFARTSQANRNKALYYPEYIEATITEQNGVLHGKYRSRYQIVDRAISPDVNFEFTGTASGGSLTCAWTGPGGARGQLMLHMEGDNSMKVDWTASELGSVQGLASGTATLTRRIR